MQTDNQLVLPANRFDNDDMNSAYTPNLKHYPCSET